MKLKNFLTELAATKATIKPYASQDEVYEVSIDTNDGHKFWYKAEKQSFMPPYETKFRDILGEELYDLIKRDSLLIEGWDIEFEDENHQQEITPKGAGTAMALFAALEQVFEDWFKKYKPNFFFFGSLNTESSRVKLYETLSKKIKKKLTSHEHFTFRSGQIDYNFFIKKKKYKPIHVSRFEYRIK